MERLNRLVREHDEILRMLDIMRRASLNILSDPAAVDVPAFRKMVDFIRKYADKIHHGKEEEFLFKAMLDELGEMGENLVRHGMLVEHDLGRLYVSDLETALDSYEAAPSNEARLSILVAAGSYEQLLRRHIQKENEVIFPFAEKRLSRESACRVEELMLAFEDDAVNAAERERQLSVLAEMGKP